jgi:Major capsid protein Gp23
MSQLLESRWSETKEALLEGLQGTKKSVMSTVLENTRKSLTESATAGATSAGNVATLNRVILPVIRRVMPTVIANELIGIQPMTGPVGQIHTLRVRYANSFTGSAGGSTTAGDEALSPFKIAEGYSGNTNGKADATAAREAVAGNQLSIQILKQTVEAKSRKLSARWTFEAAQDAQAQQGIDIEAEIMAALAQEITAEIDQEILTSLATLAGTNNTIAWNQTQVSGVATFVGDEHASLAVAINRVANTIAQRTRRGAGNWAVVSPTALTILQSATTSAFARTTEGTFEAPTNTKFVGTLNSAMKVYVNTYAANDDVLIGYKGSTESDAAAFFCPYIPLMSSGVVLDPSTFEPVVSFLTRYGYVELVSTSSSLGNAADYLGKVTVAQASFF